jgi:hypothetical protein
LGVVLHTVAAKVIPPGRITRPSPPQDLALICHDRPGLSSKNHHELYFCGRDNLM